MSGLIPSNAVKLLEFTLPLPARELSPNGRAHWAAKGAKVKAHRQAGQLAALAARNRASGFAVVCPALRVTWHCGGAKIGRMFAEPGLRPRDTDNATGAFKAYRDGIADALFGGEDSSLIELPPVLLHGKDAGGWAGLVVEVYDLDPHRDERGEA